MRRLPTIKPERCLLAKISVKIPLTFFTKSAVAIKIKTKATTIDKNNKIVVFVGGVIPEQDYQFLYDNNISAIFGPGTSILDSAEKVIELISKK